MEFSDAELKVLFASVAATYDNAVDSVRQDLSDDQNRLLSSLLVRFEAEFPQGYAEPGP